MALQLFDISDGKQQSKNSFGLHRRFAYVSVTGNSADEEPAMIIDRPRADKKTAAVIPLSCAYKYSPEDDGEIVDTYIAVANIAVTLGLINSLRMPVMYDNEEKRIMSRLAMYVADGIDELIKMPPVQRQKKIVGQGEVFEGSNKVGEFDIPASMVN